MSSTGEGSERAFARRHRRRARTHRRAPRDPAGVLAYAAPRKYWMPLALAARRGRAAADGGGDLAVQGRRRRGARSPGTSGRSRLIAAAYVGLTLLQASSAGADRMLLHLADPAFPGRCPQRSACPSPTPAPRLLHPEPTRRPDVPGVRRRLRDRVVPGVRDRAGRSPTCSSWSSSPSRCSGCEPHARLLSLVVTPLFWLTSRYFSTRIKAISREKSAPLGLDQHLDRADPEHHAAGPGLRPGRARGRAVPRRGRGEVPRRDGVGPDCAPSTRRRSS